MAKKAVWEKENAKKKSQEADVEAEGESQADREEHGRKNPSLVDKINASKKTMNQSSRDRKGPDRRSSPVHRSSDAR